MLRFCVTRNLERCSIAKIELTLAFYIRIVKRDRYHWSEQTDITKLLRGVCCNHFRRPRSASTVTSRQRVAISTSAGDAAPALVHAAGLQWQIFIFRITFSRSATPVPVWSWHLAHQPRPCPQRLVRICNTGLPHHPFPLGLYRLNCYL
jgi:hypothetical protein